MNILTLDLDMIDDTDRLRPVDPAWARVIAASIEEQGQITPIDVAVADRDGRHKLIAGAHRMQAVRILGRRTIQAIVSDVSAEQAQLREIDENLARADLNDLDRAIFLGRRKEIYEALHPVTKHGKSSKKDKVANSATILRFTLDTARLTKQSERTIQQLVHRYKHLAPSVRERLRGTWLAQVGTELDAIARLTHAEQETVVDMLLREQDPQPTVAIATRMARGIPLKPTDATDVELKRLMGAWAKAGAKARAQFRAFIATEGKKGGK
ncbi:MAG TPA: ParB N-terminal domain-containing protein [Gammaproteobacteria bacterium]|nr:ParB N-terminal domain-containing protein [Gammaproteobacteria bacterium]